MSMPRHVSDSTCPVGDYLDQRQAAISPSYTDITVHVAANEDPYGRFLFGSSSQEKRVAEDYLAGFSNTASASFTVLRSQGLAEEVQVCLQVQVQCLYNFNLSVTLIACYLTSGALGGLFSASGWNPPRNQRPALHS